MKITNFIKLNCILYENTSRQLPLAIECIQDQKASWFIHKANRNLNPCVHIIVNKLDKMLNDFSTVP